jgi:hypothetical protein
MMINQVVDMNRNGKWTDENGEIPEFDPTIIDNLSSEEMKTSVGKIFLFNRCEFEECQDELKSWLKRFWVDFYGATINDIAVKMQAFTRPVQRKATKEGFHQRSSLCKLGNVEFHVS